MTVYAVSQEYLDEMNEPFILPAFAEAELLNLDAAAQAQVSISTYTGALTGCQTGNIVKVSAEHVDNFATLEPDRMTADGSYGFGYTDRFAGSGVVPQRKNHRFGFTEAAMAGAYPQGVFWDDSGAGKRRYTQSSLHRYQRRHDAGTPAAQGHPCSQQRRREI